MVTGGLANLSWDKALVGMNTRSLCRMGSNSTPAAPHLACWKHQGAMGGCLGGCGEEGGAVSSLSMPVRPPLCFVPRQRLWGLQSAAARQGRVMRRTGLVLLLDWGRREAVHGEDGLWVLSCSMPAGDKG